MDYEQEKAAQAIFDEYIRKSGKTVNNIEIIQPRLVNGVSTFIDPAGSRDRIAKFKVAQGQRQFAFGIFDKDFRDKDPLFATKPDPETSKVVLQHPIMRLLPADTATDQIYDFYFPFMPQEITYSQMSDEIAEIPRAGTTPLVTFKSQQLMKISFEFVVAYPFDGLIRDVEDSIAILRFMATNSHRSLVFFNMDSIFQFGEKYRTLPNGGTMLRWNIVELEMTSKRRNNAGLISQATFNITLQENRNPVVTVVKVPPPVITIKKCVDKKGKKIPCKTTDTKEVKQKVTLGMDSIFAGGGYGGLQQTWKDPTTGKILPIQP